MTRQARAYTHLARLMERAAIACIIEIEKRNDRLPAKNIPSIGTEFPLLARSRRQTSVANGR